MKTYLLSVATPLAFVAALVLFSPGSHGQGPGTKNGRTTGGGTPKDLAAADRAQDFVFLSESRPLLVRVHVRINGKPLQAAWDEFAAHVFKLYDTNKDGLLSKDELDRMPPLAQIRSGGPSVYGSFMEYGEAPSKDADKDVKLDLARFTARLREQGLAPFQLETEREQDNEIMLYMGTSKTQPPNQAVSDAIFNQLDANRDGKITRAELAAAPDLLTLLDSNDDDLLIPREIAPNARATAGAGMMMGSMGRSSRNSLKGLDDGKVILISVPGEAPNNLAARMQKTYFRKGKRPETPLGEWIDEGLRSFGLGSAAASSNFWGTPGPISARITTDDDGKVTAINVGGGGKGGKKKGSIIASEVLTRAELGLDSATFAALDKNADGRLDAAELAGFVKRAPDVELTVELGQRKAGQERVRIQAGSSPLADRIRAQADFAMIELGGSRTELRGKENADSSIIDGFARRQIVANFKQQAGSKGYIEHNNSGGYTGRYSTAFKAMDRNGDGKITEPEFIAYLDDLSDLKKRLQQASVTIVLTDESRGLFDQLDANRDGKLSLRELRGAAKLLERLDPAGKGFITKSDVPRCQRITILRGPAAADDAFSAQLALIYGLQPAEDEETAGAGPAWFRKMDRNRDGDVSRSEWLGSDELFRRIDTDGDGLISLEEATRYDADRRRD